MDILDNNALFEILVKSEPIGVAQLCKTDRKYSRLCSDQTVFRRLMAIHYPQFTIDFRNPKQQYLNITGNIGVEYDVKITLVDVRGKNAEKINITTNGKSETVKLGEIIEPVAKRSEYNDDTDNGYNDFSTTIGYVNFTILGTEVFKTAFLLVHRFTIENYENNFDIRAYKTIEDAAEDFTNENYDGFVTELNEENEALAMGSDDEIDYHMGGNVSELDFADVLESRHLPTNFSKSILKEYMIENLYFSLNRDDTDAPYWRIIHVTLE